MICVPTFNQGERVCIIEGGKCSDKTYVIKKIFEIDDCATMFFLKSENDQRLHILQQDSNTILKKIT